MTYPGLVFKIILISTLVFTLILLSVNGAPADLQNNEKNCTDSNSSEDNDFDEIIDQSQNGSENYRLTIKDILVVFAPVNSLLAATSLMDSQIFGEDFLNTGELSQVNKPHVEENHPLIVDLMENKPLVSNSSEIMVPANETGKPAIINPTTKPASVRRSGLNYPSLIGPFLRRKQL